MRVLLTDGSGLTSKQVSHQLAGDGHHVEVLAPLGFNLARCTRSVRRIHPVPPYGADPLAWFEAALAVWERGSFDVLVPTQEQVAVLALARQRLEASGVHTAVPSFEAVAAVQDKVSAHRTLHRLGLPQPEATVVVRAGDLAARTDLPLFVKEAVGTASTGVHLVEDRAALAQVVVDLERRGAFDRGGVLAQMPVPGRLAMVQGVFGHGRLVAFHACLRTAVGCNGGASHKRSVDLPDVRADLARLGRALDWHGALSADVIVGPDGPRIIDVNPRLVEPANAYASGVNLVGALIEVAEAGVAPGSGGAELSPPAAGVVGVNTHQLLIGVLGAAVTAGRRGVVTELFRAALRRGLFCDSTEELTPVGGDPLSALPVLAAATATLVRPTNATWFTNGSVRSYALSPEGWQALLDAAGEGLSSTAASATGPGWPR